MSSIKERILKTELLGSLVAICLIIAFLMFGANFNKYGIPYWLFMTILLVNATISIVCYLSYCILKIMSWQKLLGTDKLLFIPKAIILTIALYFTVSFPVDILFRN
jgi:hypothetical protein